jgi:RNA polymerase sigma-70 factor, ECF subfamily
MNRIGHPAPADVRLGTSDAAQHVADGRITSSTWVLEQRFIGVYTACYDNIYAYAARRLGPDAADDVTAETFTIAWRRIGSVPREPLPWLYRVAGNVILQNRSAAARQHAARRALDAEPRPGPAGEDHVLWEAWYQLRPQDQEVLALIAWEELSVRDAARALGCAPAVFSVRLHRARKRLERRFQRINPPSESTPAISEPS